MRLSWNEIRARAADFAREWATDSYEKGEAQSFYNDFFKIFGLTRKRVASFEHAVKLADNHHGFIDVFWKGVLLAEHKSLGRDLEEAKSQAFGYFPGLKEKELPRYLLCCDFQNFALYDLEEDLSVRFALAELPKHVEDFAFILGVQKRSFRDQDPVNVEASEIMGGLHDELEKSGFEGKPLERFLVRLLFCLFADDTGIFEPKDIFLDYLKERTQEDGSDVGPRIANLFKVLNQPPEKRQKNLDEDLAKFPYVNGALFEEPGDIPDFDGAMRAALIEAGEFKWDAISPAIFGSLFQFVMNPKERRQQGAHYTTEQNILKVIEPLFLDDLRAEFAKLKARRDTGRAKALRDFQDRLATMRFFDPACGCGNFLIIAYRELRQFELELLLELYPTGQRELDVAGMANLSKLDVTQFYGIELDPFASVIAEVALWMMDHIMNSRLSLAFGQSYVRIPLKSSPHIVCGDALEIDWADVLPAKDCSYVFGNPPFAGHQYRTADQQQGMARVWGVQGQVNRLDYVTCWFKKTADYTRKNKRIEFSFVSTNSITQGEQSGIFWPELFCAGITIRFAHRTFQWNSEARGKAAVHCVIIGMTWDGARSKVIYEYDHVKGDPHASAVTRINGYLIDAPQYAVPARSSPPPGRLRMHKGSQPTDGARLRKPEGGYVTTSNLILEDNDRAELLAADPNAEKWLRPYVGGDELISGEWRWCLWLKGADPTEIRDSKPVQERLMRVRNGRLQSPTESVREFARFPTLFTQDRQPASPYLAIPEVSSESREYIPIDILEPEIIASNQLRIIPRANLSYFGILSSLMHMSWMRVTCGRLKSDYRYAPAVYNSFPWPDLHGGKKDELEKLAKAIFDIRTNFPGSNLDALYSPGSMPPELRRGHDALDDFVDRLYRRAGFRFERDRVEHLFGLYEKLTAPLTAGIAEKPKRRARKR